MRYNANDIETNYQLNRNYNSTIKNIQIESIRQSYLFKDDIFNNIFLIFLRIYSKLLVRKMISMRIYVASTVHEMISMTIYAASTVHEMISMRIYAASTVHEKISMRIYSSSTVHKIASMRIYWTIFMKYYCHLCMYFQSVNHYFQTISLRFYWYSYSKNLLLRSSLYLIMVRKPVHPHPLRHLWQGNDADQLSKRWDPELPAIA